MQKSKFAVVSETAEKQYYPIRPGDIDSRFISGFGKAEVEWVAGRLVKYFQFLGYWGGFTLEGIHHFYRAGGWETDNIFLGLMGAWFNDAWTREGYGRWCEPADVFIAVTERGVYYVTDRFIERCASTKGPGGT